MRVRQPVRELVGHSNAVPGWVRVRYVLPDAVHGLAGDHGDRDQAVPAQLGA